MKRGKQEQVQVEERAERADEKAVVEMIARELDRRLGITILMQKVERLERDVETVRSIVSDLIPRTIAETVKSVALSEIMIANKQVQSMISDVKSAVDDVRRSLTVEATAVVSNTVRDAVSQSIQQSIQQAVGDLNSVIKDLRSVLNDVAKTNAELSQNVSKIIDIAGLSIGFRNALEAISKTEMEMNKQIDLLNNMIKRFNEVIEHLVEVTESLRLSAGDVTRQIRAGGVSEQS